MKRILLFFAMIANAAIIHAGITDICQTTIEGCNGTGNIYKLEFELDTTINGNQYFYSQIYPGIFIREEGQKILLRNTYDNIDSSANFIDIISTIIRYTIDIKDTLLFLIY